MLTIKKIRIKNFRSLVDENIDFSDVNFFVGKNDSGKSNVLKALNLFFNGETDFGCDFDFSIDYSKFAKKVMKHAKEINMSNVTMEISIPLDEDGFIEMECDFCKNRFMLHKNVYESEDNINFFCPVCGLPNRSNTFFCPEVLEKAQQKVLNYMYGEINRMFGKTIRDINKIKLNKIQIQTAHRETETLKILKPIYGRRLQEVTPTLLQNFLINDCTKYANSVIDKVFMLLGRIFTGAVNEKIIGENPMKFVEKPKSIKKEEKVRALTIKEEIEFIRVLTTEDIKYSEEMLLSLFTGMRMGEVVVLSVSDIDFKLGYINIHRTMATNDKGNPFINDQTKTSTGMRKIKITDEIKNLLIEICRGKSEDDFVFVRDDGKLVSRQMVYSSFYRMIDKYKFIKPQINMKVNLHSLRHTFATRCIESGMQAKVLQHILGHKDITTTYNTYGDVFDKFEFDNIMNAEIYFKQNGLTLNSLKDN